jgi:HAD superfamily hydrolase (TIGR01509 family)
MAIKAVIFDLDGTLIDSMGVWSAVDVEFLGKRGIAVPDDLFKDMPLGNSFEEIARYFKGKFGLPDSVQSIIEEWTEMVEWHYEHDILVKPGVPELLGRLHTAGIRLGIGSSSRHVLIDKVLTANGVRQYFDAVVVGGAPLRGKPFPDVFLKGAELLGVKPEECVVIEDVLAGVQAARNAGMKVIGIKDSFSCDEWPEMARIADGLEEDYEGVTRQIMAFISA